MRGSAASLVANVTVAEPTVTRRISAAWPSFSAIAVCEFLMRKVRGAADPDVCGPCLAGMVAKTQYYTATSIDGFIADAGNSLDWLFQAGSSSGKEDRFSHFFADVGAMAMAGATTYEWVLEHEHLIDDPGKWRHYYGSVPCWVFTHRQLPVIPGADLVFAYGEVRGVHEEMRRAAGGRNIWLVGGGELAGQFADEGCSMRSCSGSRR